MSLFNELKRRNVFKVAVAYTVAAWVLLQVVDLVLESIHAPAWVMQVFLLIVVLGFLVAVIIAWAYEMTPEGLKRDSEVQREESIAGHTAKKLDKLTVVLLVVVGLMVIADRLIPESSDNPEPLTTDAIPTKTQTTTETAQPLESQRAQADKSVAVLPFAFRSNNQDDEFFAAGMHDDLLTQLAKIGSLKVISRTSVMEYRDTIKKIPQIAAELGVATILEGGVQRSGNRIRFNAQLIDARTDEHLWAETYNRELTAENLFDIQAEISRAIAKALQATLSPAESANMDRAMTTNLQAWEAYQRALPAILRIQPESLRVGLSEINRALELDPGFAAAWSVKAILLLQQYWFFDTDTATRDTARNAIDAGRSIDPTLADLDLAEGYYYYWGFRNYTKALEFIQKAAVFMPGSSRAHEARAYVLRRMGRWEEALAAFDQGLELDPRNTTIMAEIGDTLIGLRRFDAARKMLKKAQQVGSNDSRIFDIQARISLYGSGDFKNADYFGQLYSSSYPAAQVLAWRSSLYLDDFVAALQKVDTWPQHFLDTKNYRVSKAMLIGLTRLYSGDTQAARPLLLESQQQFVELLAVNPGDFPVQMSLCRITGALGDLATAKQHCHNALLAAPKDAFELGETKFYAATGLASAGDAQGAVELLQTMLTAEVGPTIYPVIYHPAFDGIREDPAYIELLNKYGPQEP